MSKSNRTQTVAEKMALVRQEYGSVEKHQKQEITDLPRWVRMALVEYETLGLTYKEVAPKFGKAGKTLEVYGGSPAGKKWRAQIREVANDPIRVAEATMRANAANVTLDYLLALQQAIEAQDYREVGVMSRDVLDRLGITKKDKSGSAKQKPTIVINLGGGVTLDPSMVETSYEEDANVVDAEWEEDDDESR